MSSEVAIYTTRLAEVGDITYVGEAEEGSDEADAIWRIKRIDETSGIIILWADGNSNFDNIWDNGVVDYTDKSYS